MKLGLLLFALVVVIGCDNDPRHYRSDQTFVVISDIESPDKMFVITEYQFDIGALGYSRVFWAIAPNNAERINFADHLLPDGYKAFGWTENNEAIVEKWEPYYYKDEIIDLKTGDVYKGVKLVVK